MVMSLIESLTRIKSAVYGREVREAIHDGVFRANQISDRADIKADKTQIRQDAVEDFNTQVVQEMTDRDIISAPEIIAARGGEQTLGNRLSTLTGRINQTTLTVATIDELKSTDLTLGDLVNTSGYYQPDDGGGSQFKVVATGVDNGGTCIALVNGLFAEMINTTVVSSRQFGASSVSSADNMERVLKMFRDARTYDVRLDNVAVNEPIPLLKNVVSGTVTMSASGTIIQAKSEVFIKGLDVEVSQGYADKVIQVKGPFITLEDIYIYNHNHHNYGLPGGFIGVEISPFTEVGELFYFDALNGVHGLKMNRVRVKKAKVGLNVSIEKPLQWFTASAIENCIFSWFGTDGIKVTQSNEQANIGNMIGAVSISKCEITDNLTSETVRYGIRLINPVGLLFTDLIMFSDGDDANFDGIYVDMPFITSLKTDVTTGMLTNGLIVGKYNGGTFVNCGTDGRKSFNGWERMFSFYSSFDRPNTTIGDKLFFYDLLKTNDAIDLITNVPSDRFAVNEQGLWLGYPVATGERSVEITLIDKLKNSKELYICLLINRNFTRPTIELYQGSAVVPASTYDAKPWGIDANSAFYRIITNQAYDKIKIKLDNGVSGPDYVISSIICTNKITTGIESFLETHVINAHDFNNDW